MAKSGPNCGVESSTELRQLLRGIHFQQQITVGLVNRTDGERFSTARLAWTCVFLLSSCVFEKWLSSASAISVPYAQVDLSPFRHA